VTGDLSNIQFLVPERIRQAGFVNTPFPVLAESRAMALLSNYGFGFKTKLLDAIMMDCYALVPQMLFNRLPPEIKAFCIVVNPNSLQSLMDALLRSSLPFPKGDLNGQLKKRAYSVLDELLVY
jgi:hypothetical protein